MDSRSAHSRTPLRRGAVLIVAMIVVFALASMVLALGRSMNTEMTASANDLAVRQATAAARGAEQYVLAYLSLTVDEQKQHGEEAFGAVRIGEAYVWFVRPTDSDNRLPVFGLTDESAKLDLNTVSIDDLRRLPGMTEELAASIIDWRDEDDDVTTSGAESATYLSQVDGYRAKNAAFETVEEVRLVRGMTPELLHGPAPRPPLGGSGNVAQGGLTFNLDRYQTFGLFDQFTVWSTSAPATEMRGAQPIDVRQRQDRDRLRELLRSTFGAERGNQLSARIPGRDLRDVFDLALETQMTSDELAQIEDSVTSGPARGKINVNLAPREVLSCMDATDDDDAEILVASRPAPAAENAHSIAWVLDALGQESAGMGNRITGRGGTFSADIVAASGNGRAFRRVRIVVDTVEGAPRIVHRHDLTDQGWPMDAGIFESLRRGETIAS